MAIKDYWVYQERTIEKPFALYIVKEYDKRVSDKALCLDITYYHEYIPTKTHCVSEVCLYYPTIDGYIEHISRQIGEWADVNEQDREQLRRELVNII